LSERWNVEKTREWEVDGSNTQQRKESETFGLNSFDFAFGAL